MMITLGAAMLFTPVATQAKSKSKEIAITKKNFPGKILREYVCKHYDKNKNGELSYAEIKKAKSITLKMGCNNVNIKGLSKLSYMTKVNLIGVLSIKNGFELNKLKRVTSFGWDNTSRNKGKMNLKWISKLSRLKSLKLKSVDISYHSVIKKMRKLDTFLWTFEKTKKKHTIDLKLFHSINLEQLSIVNVKVYNESELKRMKALKSLILKNNGINQIDVSKNTNLLYIAIENSISQLNIDNNKKLSGVYIGKTKISNISIADRGVSSIGLYDNECLKSISIINCPNILSLGISGNSVQELHVINTPNIVRLTICLPETSPILDLSPMNKVTTLNITLKENVIDLTKFSNVEELDYCLKAVVDTVDINNSKIKKLSFRSFASVNKLNISGASCLVSVDCFHSGISELILGSHPNLKRLNCNNNKITGTLNLSQTPALYNIDCSNNQLTFLDFHNCWRLTTVYCENNQLKNINITGSWLLYFYAGGNPMVNIYCVGTPERYGWDKSAVIHHLDWITGDLW